MPHRASPRRVAWPTGSREPGGTVSKLPFPVPRSSSKVLHFNSPARKRPPQFNTRPGNEGRHFQPRPSSASEEPGRAPAWPREAGLKAPRCYRTASLHTGRTNAARPRVPPGLRPAPATSGETSSRRQQDAGQRVPRGGSDRPRCPQSHGSPGALRTRAWLGDTAGRQGEELPGVSRTGPASLWGHLQVWGCKPESVTNAALLDMPLRSQHPCPAASPGCPGPRPRQRAGLGRQVSRAEATWKGTASQPRTPVVTREFPRKGRAGPGLLDTPAPWGLKAGPAW